MCLRLQRLRTLDTGCGYRVRSDPNLSGVFCFIEYNKSNPLDHVFTDRQEHRDAHDSRGALPQRDTLSPAELLPGMASCVKQKRKLFLGRLPAAVAWFHLHGPVIGVSLSRVPGPV